MNEYISFCMLANGLEMPGFSEWNFINVCGSIINVCGFKGHGFSGFLSCVCITISCVFIRVGL
jgi:hypothetical protein